MDGGTGGTATTSASSSRPTSPVEEAEEALTPSEDDECKRMAQTRRKSSVWKKALNIKKQISKMKITDGVRRSSNLFGPTEGTPLSPVEVSPDVTPNEAKPEYVQQLEHEVVQSINDLRLTMALDRTPDDSGYRGFEPDTDFTGDGDPDTEWKKRVVTQPQCLQTRRSDVSDELATRFSAQQNDEYRLNRPADLPLFDENGRPIAPPRTKSIETRNQRLLSVPNIKYNRNACDPSRPRARKESATTSSFAGNLMRRFSKYLI